jgi:hypothetical protein
MEEAGMGDAATSRAGYIAGGEAEEDWAMAVTGKSRHRDSETCYS